MNFQLNIVTIKDGIIDYAGDTISVSKRILKQLTDFRPLWKDTQPAMIANTRQVWADGQSAWLDLSPGYLAWKIKKGYSSKKNVRTGAMYDAMLTGQINIMDNTKWVWGIDTGNSVWFEGGKSNIAYPILANEKRSFIRITKEFLTRFDENKKNYLARIFKRGGSRTNNKA